MKKLVGFFKGNKGFTLIELLVVIAILGVLVAVALPNIISLVTSGNFAGAMAEQATVQTALDAYVTEKQGALPTSGDLNALNGYIRGTSSIIKATYKWGADGRVLPDTVGSWEGIKILFDHFEKS